MKITHASGEAYDLRPGTEVEFTRFNPFFNELGEQSIPVNLPATRKNLQLLNHPDRADSKSKQDSRLNASISSGAFSVVGRQAILSAQSGGDIETSFYLHEGAFYEKVEDVMLFEIFENKKISFTTIEMAINFMYTLVPGNDSRFAVFEVMTDQYTLNKTSTAITPQGYYKFVNEVASEETIDGKKVSIPKGFYLTPFVKVKHILQEVLAYLGYTLAPSFLDMVPFDDMVFLNNNIDTIVGNSINYVDVIPDISVKTLFDVLRKFNIEFRPDETNKIIHLVPFDDQLDTPIPTDLSPYAISKPVINYHNKYKQLRLSSEQISLPGEISALDWMGHRGGISTQSIDDQSMDFISIFTRFPTCYLRQNDGYIVRDGVLGERTFVEKIAHLGVDYYAGGPLATDEHSFPDVVPAMYTAKTVYVSGYSTYKVTPFVGTGRALQSKIVFQDDQNNDEVVDGSQLKPMLCLFYSKTTHSTGTIHNYDEAGNKLWENSIGWNGPDGIFEKFWRKRDTLLRNALLEVQVDSILPEDIKMNLSPIKQVLLNSQTYLVSEINYSTKNKSIGSCALLSTKLQEPVSEARPAKDYFRQKKYTWTSKYTRSWTNPPGEGTVFNYLMEPVAFYPPDPTQAQYTAGGRYYERTYEVEYGRRDQRTGVFSKLGDGTVTTWLEAVLHE